MEEKKTARDLWVEDEIEFFISKIKPFYLKDDLKILENNMRTIFGLDGHRAGVIKYYEKYRGRYAYSFSKTLYNKSPEEEKVAIRRFWHNFYNLVKAVSKQDYETAQKAYNEEFAFYGQQNNLKGPDFLCQYVIPGCKVGGFKELIQENINRDDYRHVRDAERKNLKKVKNALEMELNNKKDETAIESQPGNI